SGLSCTSSIWTRRLKRALILQIARKYPTSGRGRRSLARYRQRHTAPAAAQMGGREALATPSPRAAVAAARASTVRRAVLWRTRRDAGPDASPGAAQRHQSASHQLLSLAEARPLRRARV